MLEIEAKCIFTLLVKFSLEINYFPKSTRKHILKPDQKTIETGILTWSNDVSLSKIYCLHKMKLFSPKFPSFMLPNLFDTHNSKVNRGSKHKYKLF